MRANEIQEERSVSATFGQSRTACPTSDSPPQSQTPSQNTSAAAWDEFVAKTRQEKTRVLLPERNVSSHTHSGYAVGRREGPEQRSGCEGIRTLMFGRCLPPWLFLFQVSGCRTVGFGRSAAVRMAPLRSAGRRPSCERGRKQKIESLQVGAWPHCRRNGQLGFTKRVCMSDRTRFWLVVRRGTGRCETVALRRGRETAHKHTHFVSPHGGPSEGRIHAKAFIPSTQVRNQGQLKSYNHAHRFSSLGEQGHPFSQHNPVPPFS